jgi:DNA-binding NarL/FixJ family response regulator
MDAPVGLRIVGWDRLLVEAIVAWLAARPDFRVIDPSLNPSSGEAVDVVLLDASRRDEALAAAWKLGEELPGAKLLVFGIEGIEGIEESEAEAGTVLDFVEAGARGYLLKGASTADLAAALHDVHAGRTRCSPRIVEAVLARIRRLGELGETDRGRAAAPREPLTVRELQILHLLAGGLSNKEIGSRLQISLSTVKNHLHNLLVKLGVRRRREAIRLAYELGLLPDL